MSIPRTIIAKYTGRCRCGRTFSAGSVVTWSDDTRRVLECTGCKPRIRGTINKPAPTPLPDKEDLLTHEPLGWAFRPITPLKR